MKSWICKCSAKNDYAAATCFICGSESTVVMKEPKPIRKNSKSREAQMNEYLKKVAKWKKGKICLMCDWEGKKNTDISCHHMGGKEGALLLDHTKWIPLCFTHHTWATEHSKEAIELGISLPRNSTPQ